MRKIIQQKLKDQKGLTLIELLAVIVILAIIAAIAIPAIGNIIQNSRIDAAKSDALNIISAASLYESQEGPIDATTGVTIAQLVLLGFLEDSGAITDTGKVFPGPSIFGTATDIIGTNDLIFGTATVPVDKNTISNADSTSTIRTELEKAATNFTID